MAKSSVLINDREVVLSAGITRDEHERNPQEQLAWLLRKIADIVEKDGRIFDTIHLRWE